MVFISIYKKDHVFREGGFLEEKPRGIGDLVLVFKQERRVLVQDEKDENVHRIAQYMVESPFMFIPLIDDGIDESIYLPNDISPEDMLFIEHLLPKWYYLNNEFRNITLDVIEPFLSKNGYTVVEGFTNQNELFDHVFETLGKSKVLLDGEEYHKKIFVFLDYCEYNGITFIPEDPEITRIKKELNNFSS